MLNSKVLEEPRVFVDNDHCYAWNRDQRVKICVWSDEWCDYELIPVTLNWMEALIIIMPSRSRISLQWIETK